MLLFPFFMMAVVAIAGVVIGGPGYLLTIIFGGLEVMFLTILYFTGSFRPCKKCGLRLTIREGSKDSEATHPSEVTVCYIPWCRKVTVLQNNT